MAFHSTFSACIFDLDGVLVDTAKYHFRAWRRLANELGFDFDEHANETLKGVGRRESLELILGWGKITMSPEEKESWMDRKNGWYLEFVHGMTPADILDGVPEFLADVKKHGLRVALGSGSKNTKAVVKCIGLEGFFESISDGTRITRSKPDPQVFLLCAEDMGLDPGRCIVFEDAISGIDAAIAGGFHSVGVGREDALGHADLVIPGFKGWTWPKMESALLNSTRI